MSIPHAMCGHNKKRGVVALDGDIGGACVRPNASRSTVAFMGIEMRIVPCVEA